VNVLQHPFGGELLDLIAVDAVEAGRADAVEAKPVPAETKIIGFVTSSCR
jgi:hypothetical protein